MRNSSFQPSCSPKAPMNCLPRPTSPTKPRPSVLRPLGDATATQPQPSPRLHYGGPKGAETLAHDITTEISSGDVGLQQQLQAAILELRDEPQASATIAIPGGRIHLSRLSPCRAPNALLHVVVELQPPGAEPALHCLTLTLSDEHTGPQTAPVLSNTEWTGLDLRGINLKDAVLTGITLDTCRLDHAQLAGSHWSDGLFKGIESMQQTDLRGASLSRCSWMQCSLHQCSLANSQWDNCRVERTAWSHCDLSEARFTACPLLGWTTKSCHWQQTRFKECLVDTLVQLPASAIPAAFKQPSDVIHPGDVVLIPTIGPRFIHQFGQHLRAEGVAVLKVSEGAVWLRDTQFKAQVPGDGAAFRVTIAPPGKVGLIKGGPGVGQHRMHQQQLVPNALGKEPQLPKLEADSAAPLRVYSSSQASGSLQGSFQMATTRFVPGGNMIIVNPKLALVGNDVLHHPDGMPEELRPNTPENRSKADRAYPGVAEPTQRWALWNQRKLAKADLQQLLGVEHLVLLPQLMYHIDLFVTHVGDHLLVHSFDETVKFLRENEQALIQRYGQDRFDVLLKANEAMRDRWEGEVIQVICDKLDKAGLKVHKVCGMLITEIAANGAPEGLQTLLTNGLTLDKGPGHSPIYLCAGAPNDPEHEQYFKNFCAQLGVVTRFVYGDPDDEDDPYADPQEFIRAVHGAVRCLSNTNSVAVLDTEVNDDLSPADVPGPLPT